MGSLFLDYIYKIKWSKKRKRKKKKRGKKTKKKLSFYNSWVIDKEEVEEEGFLFKCYLKGVDFITIRKEQKKVFFFQICKIVLHYILSFECVCFCFFLFPLFTFVYKRMLSTGVFRYNKWHWSAAK